MFKNELTIEEGYNLKKFVTQKKIIKYVICVIKGCQRKSFMLKRNLKIKCKKKIKNMLY